MTKLLCWLRRHDWRESGTKQRTGPAGDMLPEAMSLTKTCARCGRISDLYVIGLEGTPGALWGKTRVYDYIPRGRSRVEKLGDGIVLAAILIILAMLYAVAREYWG